MNKSFGTLFNLLSVSLSESIHHASNRQQMQVVAFAPDAISAQLMLLPLVVSIRNVPKH